jgi:hypothetical protein
MAKKRSTRNSNNTSINTSNNASSNTGINAIGSEDKDRKQKNNPYYTWW